MILQERIDQLDDFTLLKFYNHFTATLIAQINADLPTIIAIIPDSIRHLPEIDSVLQADPGVMGKTVQSGEAVAFARQTLSFWANDPQLVPLLDDLLTNYRDTELAAGVLLELGGAVSMLLLMGTSSIKRHKDGTWEINILGLPAEDVDARIRLIKALFKSIPEAIASYFPYFKS
jgi:hypothetical protein